jgi:hypothetical protein
MLKRSRKGPGDDDQRTRERELLWLVVWGPWARSRRVTYRSAPPDEVVTTRRYPADGPYEDRYPSDGPYEDRYPR